MPMVNPVAGKNFSNLSFHILFHYIFVKREIVINFFFDFTSSETNLFNFSLTWISRLYFKLTWNNRQDINEKYTEQAQG